MAETFIRVTQSDTGQEIVINLRAIAWIESNAPNAAGSMIFFSGMEGDNIAVTDDYEAIKRLIIGGQS